MAWSFELRLVLALAAIASAMSAQKPMFVDRAVNSDAKARDVPRLVRSQYNAIESERRPRAARPQRRRTVGYSN